MNESQRAQWTVDLEYSKEEVKATDRKLSKLIQNRTDVTPAPHRETDSHTAETLAPQTRDIIAKHRNVSEQTMGGRREYPRPGERGERGGLSTRREVSIF